MNNEPLDLDTLEADAKRVFDARQGRRLYIEADEGEDQDALEQIVEMLPTIVAALRGRAAAPLSDTILLDDPFTEGQKRQLDEALHFQNALVDLLGEPNEKLEPWALAKIKAMQEALAAAEARIAIVCDRKDVDYDQVVDDMAAASEAKAIMERSPL